MQNRDYRQPETLRLTEGPSLTQILELEKKPGYTKFMLVGLQGSNTNTKIPHLHVHKPKTEVM